MLATTNNYKAAIGASVRSTVAKVELYNGSTLVATYTQNDAIKSIDIERVGEDSKFFGFGVTHRFNIKLIDVPRAINITTANYFKINLGVVLPGGSIEYVPFPKAYVTEVNRDENTNELSITAYDALNKAKTLTVSDLGLNESYTIREVIVACEGLLSTSGVSIPESLTEFDLEYPTGANFEGTETLQYGLTVAAEATQTIYYINGDDVLVYKRLDKDGAAVKTITKENYITLDSSTNRRLATICSATELGDNVSASTTEIGTTQYVRDNPFWELREDIATLVDNALAAVGGMTINQFECDWRGDFSLEPGDKIDFITKDNKTVTSYLLNDSLSYNGAFAEKTEWQYTESEGVDSNPTTLGEVLKQTYARVDKANKKVDILVSQVETNKSNISSLQLTTDSISATVESLETTTNSQVETINNLVLKADGITNTLDNRGGNNLLRNSYFYEYENGLLTYWSGPQKVVEKYESKSRNALSLQNGTIKQSVGLTNKKYCCSFKYIKLSEVANAKFIINGKEYILDGNVDTEKKFEIVEDLKTDSITIEFVCDTNDGFLVYEVMLNEGESASVFTQNTSESISDTVNIGKGVEVLASNIKNKTRIDADGLRGINTETNELTFYQTTDGIYGKEVETESMRSGNLIVTTRNGHNFISGL